MKVAALVVTRDRRQLLEECLEAIGRQTHPVEHVIVVDNASTDGTPEFLETLSSPGLIVSTLKENTGGAGGFAHGLELGSQLPVDLIWLMDDDCIPHPEALGRLVQAGDELSELGQSYSFLCSRVIDTFGAACNHPVPSSALNSSGWPRWAELAHQGYVLVDECTFVSVAVPIAYLRKVGLPFREMFIWGDDTEYTHRLASQAPGIFVGVSEVLHKRVLRGGLSIHNDEPGNRLRFYRHFYRNRAYVYRTYFPTWRYFALLLQFSWETLRLALRGRFGRAWLVARGTFEGLWFNPPVRMVPGPFGGSVESRGELPSRSAPKSNAA